MEFQFNANDRAKNKVKENICLPTYIISFLVLYNHTNDVINLNREKLFIFMCDYYSIQGYCIIYYFAFEFRS